MKGDGIKEIFGYNEVIEKIILFNEFEYEIISYIRETVLRGRKISPYLIFRTLKISFKEKNISFELWKKELRDIYGK